MYLHIFLFVYSILAISSAYVAQYYFDLEPCILCLYQRIPYFAVIILSFVSFFLKGIPKLIVIALCGLLILTGGAIATYHVGVESGKFQMTEGCANNDEANSTIEQMTKNILGSPTKPCNEVAFTFLGLSMASWNMILSFSIGFIVLVNVYKVIANFRYIKKSNKYNNDKVNE